MASSKHIILAVLKSVTISFLFTNLYWVLSATYVKRVVQHGSDAVLVGLPAAYKLLQIHGLSAYLDGMFGFCIAAILCGLFCVFFFKNYVHSHMGKILIGLSVSILIGCIYSLLSTELVMTDFSEGTQYILRGLDAAKQIGAVRLALSLLGIGFLLFLSTYFQLLAIIKD